MQQETPQLSLQNWLTGLFILAWLTFIGGLPISLLARLFYNADVGSEVGWLTGALVASWLPLKLLVDRFVKDNRNVSTVVAGLLPRFSVPTIIVTALIGMIVVPVLWFIIAPAFLAGILAYALLGQNLVGGLIVGLIVQLGLIYRNAQIEKQRGTNSAFFVRVESMQSSFNLNTITIPTDNVNIEESITSGYARFDTGEGEPPITIVQSPASLSETDDEGEPPITIVQSPNKPSDS